MKLSFYWLICFFVLCTTIGYSQSVVSDISVGGASVRYFNTEFSPDMRYMTFTEFVSGTNAKDWMCRMDTATGLIADGGDGREFLLHDRPNYATTKQINPQWGQDAQGYFSVTMDTEGRFLIFRPNGNAAPSRTVLATPPNDSRFLPYPARLPDRAQSYIAYFQKDAAGRVQIYCIDMANPTVEIPITTGAPGIYSATMSPAIFLDIQRWFWAVVGAPSSATRGLPEFVYGFMNDRNKLQIKNADFTGIAAGSAPRITTVTDDDYDHIDDFTALVGNDRYLFGGINNSGSGRLYKKEPSVAFYTEAQSVNPVPTTFTKGSTFSSGEIFYWKGRYYAVYQILDENTSALPSGVLQETWLVGLNIGGVNAPVNFRVSSATANVRLDPEFYLTREKAYIYYQSRRPAGFFELRRAELSLPTVTSVQNQQQTTSMLRVQPNPAQDVVTISGLEDVSEVVVVNTLGQIVTKKSIEQTPATFDVSSLQSGLYFLRLVAQKAIHIQTLQVFR